EIYEQILAGFNSPRLQFERSNGYAWFGRELLEAGDLKEAERNLQQAALVRTFVEQTQNQDPDACLDLAEILTDLGVAQAKLKQFQVAEENFRKAHRIFSNPESYGEGDLEYRVTYDANILLLLSNTLLAQGRIKEAIASLQEAQRLQVRIPSSEKSSDAKAVFQLIDQRLESLRSSLRSPQP
ncbi:MAG: hypothetical protein KDA84_21795, partial [Planctomycetaceae bacterium]|nr:hypothetical protein [Planctomycetaceae bacterium]